MDFVKRSRVFIFILFLCWFEIRTDFVVACSGLVFPMKLNSFTLSLMIAYHLIEASQKWMEHFFVCFFLHFLWSTWASEKPMKGSAVLIAAQGLCAVLWLGMGRQQKATCWMGASCWLLPWGQNDLLVSGALMVGNSFFIFGVKLQYKLSRTWIRLVSVFMWGVCQGQIVSQDL